MYQQRGQAQQNSYFTGQQHQNHQQRQYMQRQHNDQEYQMYAVGGNGVQQINQHHNTANIHVVNQETSRELVTFNDSFDAAEVEFSQRSAIPIAHTACNKSPISRQKTGQQQALMSQPFQIAKQKRASPASGAPASYHSASQPSQTNHHEQIQSPYLKQGKAIQQTQQMQQSASSNSITINLQNNQQRKQQVKFKPQVQTGHPQQQVLQHNTSQLGIKLGAKSPQNGVSLNPSVSSSQLLQKIKFLQRGNGAQPPGNQSKDNTPKGGQAPRIKLQNTTQISNQISANLNLKSSRAINNQNTITSHTLGQKQKSQIQLKPSKKLAQQSNQICNQDEMYHKNSVTFGIDEIIKENCSHAMNKGTGHTKTPSQQFQQSEFGKPVSNISLKNYQPSTSRVVNHLGNQVNQSNYQQNSINQPIEAQCEKFQFQQPNDFPENVTDTTESIHRPYPDNGLYAEHHHREAQSNNSRQHSKNLKNQVLHSKVEQTSGNQTQSQLQSALSALEYVKKQQKYDVEQRIEQIQPVHIHFQNFIQVVDSNSNFTKAHEIQPRSKQSTGSIGAKSPSGAGSKPYLTRDQQASTSQVYLKNNSSQRDFINQQHGVSNNKSQKVMSDISPNTTPFRSNSTKRQMISGNRSQSGTPMNQAKALQALKSNTKIKMLTNQRPAGNNGVASQCVLNPESGQVTPKLQNVNSPVFAAIQNVDEHVAPSRAQNVSPNNARIVTNQPSQMDLNFAYQLNEKLHVTKIQQNQNMGSNANNSSANNSLLTDSIEDTSPQYVDATGVVHTNKTKQTKSLVDRKNNKSYSKLDELIAGNSDQITYSSSILPTKNLDQNTSSVSPLNMSQAKQCQYQSSNDPQVSCKTDLNAKLEDQEAHLMPSTKKKQIKGVSADKEPTSSIKQPQTGRLSHRFQCTQREREKQNYSATAKWQKQKISETESQRTISTSQGDSVKALMNSIGKTSSLNDNSSDTSQEPLKAAIMKRLTKYINIKVSDKVKSKVSQLSSSRKEAIPSMSALSNTQKSQEIYKVALNPEQAIQERIKQKEDQQALQMFLQFLERKKIINITEVVQDKKKLNQLIQDIKEINLTEFNEQCMQKLKNLRSRSGHSNQSRDQSNARRRHGTPVNMNGTTPKASQNQSQSSVSNVNYQNRHQQPIQPNGQKTQRTVNVSTDSKTSYSSLPIHHLNIHGQCTNNTDKQAQQTSFIGQKGSQLGFKYSQSNLVAQSQKNLNGELKKFPNVQHQHHHHQNMGDFSQNHNSVQQQVTHQSQQLQLLNNNGISCMASASSIHTNKMLSPNSSSAQLPGQSNKSHMQQMMTSGMMSNQQSSQNDTGPFQDATSTQVNQLQTVSSAALQHHPSYNSNNQKKTLNTNQQQTYNSNKQSSGRYANFTKVTVFTSKDSHKQPKPSTGSGHMRKGNSADLLHQQQSSIIISQNNNGNNQGHHHHGGGLQDDKGSLHKFYSNQNSGNHGGSQRATEFGLDQSPINGGQMNNHHRRGGSANQPVLKKVLKLSRNSSNKRSVKEIVEYMDPDGLEDNSILKDKIAKQRDYLIKFNKVYVKEHKKIPPTQLEFYKFVQLIGKGAFGKVILSIHMLTGRYVAIKAIDKQYLENSLQRKKVLQEVYILKKIKHSNIIQLYEVIESPRYFHLVMEHAGGGDLLQYVKKHRRLNEEVAKNIFRQVVYGLAHIHCRSVLHRDIKLDNILMDGRGGVKICDFGVSRLMTKNQVIREQCGTPAYLAPEISSDKGYKGFYVDLWSLGVLLYAMLQGAIPFKANNPEDLYALIMKCNIKYPVKISDDARDMIQSLLKVEPEERISIPAILKHRWLKSALNSLEDSDSEDDNHDFAVGISFKRQECNFNPFSMLSGANSNNQARCDPMSSRLQHGLNPKNQFSDTQQTEQETNPMQQIGNINVLNIENLFHDEDDDQESIVDPKRSTNLSVSKSGENQIKGANKKLSYTNYCAVTQDTGTFHIDEEALRVLEGFGYPRKLVIQSLNDGDLNHATTSYNLLVTQ